MSAAVCNKTIHNQTSQGIVIVHITNSTPPEHTCPATWNLNYILESKKASWGRLQRIVQKLVCNSADTEIWYTLGWVHIQYTALSSFLQHPSHFIRRLFSRQQAVLGSGNGRQLEGRQHTMWLGNHAPDEPGDFT